MPEEPRARRDVDALVERLVRDAELPDARAREELRRELRSHFEEAGSSSEALSAALERFGSPDVVSRGLRRAYRRGHRALYAAKVLASIAGAGVVALAVELIANLRVGTPDALVRVGDGYRVSAWFAVAIVVLVVAAWELDVEPLCARLERRPLRLVAAYAALFAAIYVAHPAFHGPIDARIIAVGSSAGVVVWACTVAIVARLDLAFAGVFGPPDE